jgi:hypothetical protein
MPKSPTIDDRLEMLELRTDALNGTVNALTIIVDCVAKLLVATSPAKVIRAIANNLKTCEIEFARMNAHEAGIRELRRVRSFYEQTASKAEGKSGSTRGRNAGSRRK